MLFWILFLCWTLTACQSDEIVFNYNNTYKYNVQYVVEVSRNVEYIMEFGGAYGSGAPDTPARVTVASDRANRSYPVFITARQQKGVFAWQLPLLVQAAGGMQEFSNVSRTLCPHNNPFARDERACDAAAGNAPTLHVSSSSPAPVRVGVLLETVADFYVRLDAPVNLTVSPSQPKYYFYPFDQGPDARLDLGREAENKRAFCAGGPPREPPARAGWLQRSRSVIVTIESDDDICAVVSVQNYSCPVFDNERDILYDGYYLTMTRRGGITLTRDTFPLGFYIVFIVKSSDEACSGNSSAPLAPLAPTAPRLKGFRLKVIETISYSEYLRGAGAALAFFLAFYVVWLAALLLQRRCSASDEDGGTAALVDGARTPPVRRRRVLNDASASARARARPARRERGPRHPAAPGAAVRDGRGAGGGGAAVGGVPRVPQQHELPVRHVVHVRDGGAVHGAAVPGAAPGHQRARARHVRRAGLHHLRGRGGRAERHAGVLGAVHDTAPARLPRAHLPDLLSRPLPPRERHRAARVECGAAARAGGGDAHALRPLRHAAARQPRQLGHRRVRADVGRARLRVAPAAGDAGQPVPVHAVLHRHEAADRRAPARAQLGLGGGRARRLGRRLLLLPRPQHQLGADAGGVAAGEPRVLAAAAVRRARRLALPVRHRHVLLLQHVPHARRQPRRRAARPDRRVLAASPRLSRLRRCRSPSLARNTPSV